MGDIDVVIVLLHFGLERLDPRRHVGGSRCGRPRGLGGLLGFSQSFAEAPVFVRQVRDRPLERGDLRRRTRLGGRLVLSGLGQLGPHRLQIVLGPRELPGQCLGLPAGFAGGARRRGASAVCLINRFGEPFLEVAPVGGQLGVLLLEHGELRGPCLGGLGILLGLGELGASRCQVASGFLKLGGHGLGLGTGVARGL